jgi:hypothetical protein
MKFEALERLGRYSEVFRTSNFSFGDRNLYSSEAQDFIELCYSDHWVQQGFDWPAWKETEEAAALRDRPEVLAEASADQLASLLTVLVRQDRFVEGSLGAAFDNGLLLRIVDRCRELAA